MNSAWLSDYPDPPAPRGERDDMMEPVPEAPLDRDGILLLASVWWPGVTVTAKDDENYRQLARIHTPSGKPEKLWQGDTWEEVAELAGLLGRQAVDTARSTGAGSLSALAAPDAHPPVPLGVEEAEQKRAAGITALGELLWHVMSDPESEPPSENSAHRDRTLYLLSKQAGR